MGSLRLHGHGATGLQAIATPGERIKQAKNRKSSVERNRPEVVLRVHNVSSNHSI